MTTNYQAILASIAADIQPELGQGQVATYIPELAAADPRAFGMALYHLPTNQLYQVGQAQQRFSIQSISKLFSTTLAFQLMGEYLWQRVGREPSGTAFNSLVQLEVENGIPRNPFINAGALVVTDILTSRFVQPEQALVQFLRRLANTADLAYNPQVAQSEIQTGHRNLAMTHFMKSFGNLENQPEQVIHAYCRHCAIEMSCVDLAYAVAFLANQGRAPWLEKEILDTSSAKRLTALMLTCGTYDAAGEFAYRVGLPAKSGVGGGIVAVLPGHWTVCVWSPALAPSGNSHAGMLALEWLTTRTGESLF
ncbi:glutaminase [Parvibium lacunae]|uniref:Glutaminase n=1 Tax=Parvibium lacunae TaxID=1888893 RepID=A0A368L058_9BURK|nr:glutaminase [Parvibium lacunae]RCS56802.1 glutaminase [Parvibium lacunae]